LGVRVLPQSGDCPAQSIELLAHVDSELGEREALLRAAMGATDVFDAMTEPLPFGLQEQDVGVQIGQRVVKRGI
jgi:hypothetical protein